MNQTLILYKYIFKCAKNIENLNNSNLNLNNISFLCYKYTHSDFYLRMFEKNKYCKPTEFVNMCFKKKTTIFSYKHRLDLGFNILPHINNLKYDIIKNTIKNSI